MNLNDKLNDFARTSFINKLFWCSLFFFTIWNIIFLLIFKDVQMVYYKISLVVGILFGFMLAGLLSLAKNSEIFWLEAKKIEDKINRTNTKKELLEIIFTDLNNLTKKCMGNPQDSEILRLHTIAETKIKCLEQK